MQGKSSLIKVFNRRRSLFLLIWILRFSIFNFKDKILKGFKFYYLFDCTASHFYPLFCSAYQAVFRASILLGQEEIESCLDIYPSLSDFLFIQVITVDFPVPHSTFPWVIYLHMVSVVYMRPSLSPTASHFPSPPWCPYIHSLHLCLSLFPLCK